MNHLGSIVCYVIIWKFNYLFEKFNTVDTCYLESLLKLRFIYVLVLVLFNLLWKSMPMWCIWINHPVLTVIRMICDSI